MGISVNFHQKEMVAESSRLSECSVVRIEDGNCNISIFVEELEHADDIANAINGHRPEKHQVEFTNELMRQRDQAEYDLGLERQRVEIYKQAMNDIICGGDVGAIIDAAKHKADNVGQLNALKDS